MIGTWVAYFDDPAGEPAPALVHSADGDGLTLIVFDVETVTAPAEAEGADPIVVDVPRAAVIRDARRDQVGKATGPFWCPLGDVA